ncbi:MAG: hypothetical protein AAFS01_01645 [Pseudomonadota bacterium]
MQNAFTVEYFYQLVKLFKHSQSDLLPKEAATRPKQALLREKLDLERKPAIFIGATSSIDPLLLLAQSLDLNDNAKLPHVAGSTN